MSSNINSRATTFLFLYLIGSTLCVIPDGEYQFGPVFGPSVSRFFGNKYFEAYADKGQLKPFLVKKALLGVAGVGVVAAAGGAALIAKKIHESKGFGHGNTQGGWYSPKVQSSSGWYPSSSYSGDNQYVQQYQQQQQGYAGNVNFASNTDYQYQSQQQGYPSGYEDNSYDYTGQSGGYSSGWSR